MGLIIQPIKKVNKRHARLSTKKKKLEKEHILIIEIYIRLCK
jgi:hypothetical protein